MIVTAVIPYSSQIMAVRSRLVARSEEHEVIMPDNPDKNAVLKRAAAAQDAQRKLRDAMAAVAADVKNTAPASPAAGGKS